MRDIEVLTIQVLLIGFLAALSAGPFQRKFYLRVHSRGVLLRVGLGGLKIARTGGIWYFSHFHILTRVTLDTFRLSVTQRVITSDLQQPTLDVSFFVRVLNEDSSIRSASRYLTGEPPSHSQLASPIRMITHESIRRVAQDRLETYVRIGAASVTLEQILSNHVPWLLEGLLHLSGDLSHYGLVVETPTVDRVIINQI